MPKYIVEVRHREPGCIDSGVVSEHDSLHRGLVGVGEAMGKIETLYPDDNDFGWEEFSVDPSNEWGWVACFRSLIRPYYEGDGTDRNPEFNMGAFVVVLKEIPESQPEAKVLNFCQQAAMIRDMGFEEDYGTPVFPEKPRSANDELEFRLKHYGYKDGGPEATVVSPM